MAERNLKPAVLQNPAIGPIDFDDSPVHSAAMTFVEDYLALEKIAAGIMASNFAPKGIKDKADIVLIFMTGQELGLSYAQALRMIYVVNGRPMLAADGMAAVVKRFCARVGGGYLRVTEQTDRHCTIEYRRHDDDKGYTVTFTWEDAQRANLTGRDTWKQYPQDMLRARATSRACRTGWPDVLGGVYDPDEMGNAYEATISGGDRTQVQRVVPIKNAEQELIADGQEIIDAPAIEPKASRTSTRTTPAAPPAATVSPTPASKLDLDGPMTEDTRRELFAAARDVLGWGPQEVFVIASNVCEIAEIGQLTERQARAIALRIRDQPKAVKAKYDELTGDTIPQDALIGALIDVANERGIDEDTLLLIAWRKFNVQALTDLTDEQLESLNTVLELSDSSLADVVTDAAEAAKQAQATHAKH